MYIYKCRLTRIIIFVMCIYIAITAVIFVTSNTGQHYFVTTQKSIRQIEKKSIKKSGESILDLTSKAERVIFDIEKALQSDIHKTSDNVSLTVTAEHLKNLLSRMKNSQAKMETALFLTQPIINFHNFSYIHNPVNACSNQSIDLLLLVPSATANFKRRQEQINSNKGDYVRNTANNARMLFFLGRPHIDKNSTEIQQNIDEESKRYGNIVQENFEDIYSNNRLKSVSMLRWASTYCPNAKYVIRSDDDIYFNISAALSVLDMIAEKMDNFIIGRQRVNDAPERRLGYKYYLSKMEYPKKKFPTYLLGGLLGFPISTVKLLYEAALRIMPIWLEDVYITGICAPKVHVPILTHIEYEFQHDDTM